MLEPVKDDVSTPLFEPMADLHLHAVKSTNEEDLKAGTVTDSWVSSEYRGVSTEEFVDAKTKEGCSQDCLFDIIDNFHQADLPTVPHIIDALYHAVMDDNYPDVLTFLTIGTPSCFTMEETIRAMEAFQSDTITSAKISLKGDLFFSKQLTGLRSDIIPTAPLNLDHRMMAKNLETLTPAAEKYGYRPVVKLHPLLQQVHLGRIPDDVFKVLNEHGALLVTHTGVFQGGPCTLEDGILDIDASDPIHMEKHASKYSNIDILLSHMGTPDKVVERYWLNRNKVVRHLLNAIQLLLDHPNIYGDIGGLMYSAPTDGNYGEEKSETEVDFTSRSELAFDSIAMRLNDPVRYGEKGKLLFRDKIVHGSDFPVTSITELKKQMRVLGTLGKGESVRRIKNNMAHRAYKLARKR